MRWSTSRSRRWTPIASLRCFRTEQYAALLELIDRSSRTLQGRVIWNVNSTARGGGVVELLRPLLGYSRGGGVDARWAVISGEPEFFAITKRLHNHLHGFTGDGGPLDAAALPSMRARSRRPPGSWCRCSARRTS